MNQIQSLAAQIAVEDRVNSVYRRQYRIGPSVVARSAAHWRLIKRRCST